MKSIWIVIITVLVTGGIIGGGGYYYLNGKNVKEKNDLQSQIDDLNAKVTAAQAALSTSAATTGTTSAGSSTTVTDPTASWKTYTNATYNFSVKYPSSVTPKEINAASFTVDFGDESISAFSDTQSLNDWVSGAITDLPTGYTYTKSNTTLDGASAIQLTVTKTSSSDAPALWVFSVNSGKHYEIMSDTSKTNFSNFLSTFQFTK